MTDLQSDDRPVADRVWRRLDDHRTRGTVACDISVVAGRMALTGQPRSRHVKRVVVAGTAGAASDVTP